MKKAVQEESATDVDVTKNLCSPQYATSVERRGQVAPLVSPRKMRVRRVLPVTNSIGTRRENCDRIDKIDQSHVA